MIMLCRTGFGAYPGSVRVRIGRVYHRVMGITVSVDGGQVSGSQSHGVTAFLGIPYAAAPEGPLAFAAPAPVTPWDGVREVVAEVRRAGRRRIRTRSEPGSAGDGHRVGR